MNVRRFVFGIAPTLVLASTAGAQRLPGRVVDIVAGDYFFRAPDTIPAGLTTLRLRTAGTGEHAAWLVRLAPGHHVAELIAAERAGAPTPWAVTLGGPGFPDVGGDANATLILTPAEYALVCYVRGPAPMRTPHFQLGMFHRLLVRTARKQPTARLPDPDLEITLTDTGIVLRDSAAAGTHLVRVVNHGTSVRELKLFRVLPGHTADESLAWKPRAGTPRPDANVTALVDIPPQDTLLSTWRLRSGMHTLFVLPTAQSPALGRTLQVHAPVTGAVHATH
jgi:hypothetical protein